MSIGMGIRLLETLTSALYEDPIVFFREYVQNSADAFIRHRVDGFRIDISIDKETKSIVFKDNGMGIPFDKFEKKMKDIGKSDKSNSIDQIGFRGIGRLAAMPFCSELVFKNKFEGESCVQVFTWNGDRYNMLLSQDTGEDDLNKAVNEITSNIEIPYDGDKKDHFFIVEIKTYSEEIEELIESPDFELKLCRLLPLKYSENFSSKNEIHEHYEEFMGEGLDKFEFNIYLNDVQLYKPYVQDNVLESDIVFWDLYFDQVSPVMPREKIGGLWFTFNRKVSSNPVNSPRGIYVRSKNMLLGNEYAIADAVTKRNDDYVATYRELTQTLNGVYGELLIDTSRLSDNARRDWFRIDKASNELRIILTDYLRKLKAYRYAASQAFNDKHAKAKRERVINAYMSLTGGFDSSKFEKEFYNEEEASSVDKYFIYADDDIPRFSASSKKFYEKIIVGLKQYCIETKGEDAIEEIIKIRTFLKKYLNSD